MYEVVQLTVRAPLQPAACIIITPFLKTISLFSSRFFQKILSLWMVSIWERFIVKSGLWWIHLYSTQIRVTRFFPSPKICLTLIGMSSENKKMLIFSTTKGHFFKTPWARQGVKLTWLMSIFTSKNSLNIFDENSADKIQSKKNKGVKVPFLMPIRVNAGPYFLKTHVCYETPQKRTASIACL